MDKISKIYLDQVAIGKRIWTLRKQQKIKISDICCFLDNISPQAVYKWQRGESLPDIENLLNLSRLFRTSIEGILLGDEEMPSLYIVKVYKMYKSVTKQKI